MATPCGRGLGLPVALTFSIKRSETALERCSRSLGHLQTHHLHRLTELPDIAECAISESSAIWHNYLGNCPLPSAAFNRPIKLVASCKPMVVLAIFPPDVIGMAPERSLSSHG